MAANIDDLPASRTCRCRRSPALLQVKRDQDRRPPGSRRRERSCPPLIWCHRRLTPWHADDRQDARIANVVEGWGSLVDVNRGLRPSSPVRTQHSRKDEAEPTRPSRALSTPCIHFLKRQGRRTGRRRADRHPGDSREGVRVGLEADLEVVTCPPTVSTLADSATTPARSSRPRSTRPHTHHQSNDARDRKFCDHAQDHGEMQKLRKRVDQVETRTHHSPTWKSDQAKVEPTPETEARADADKGDRRILPVLKARGRASRDWSTARSAPARRGRCRSG